MPVMRANDPAKYAVADRAMDAVLMHANFNNLPLSTVQSVERDGTFHIVIKVKAFAGQYEGFVERTFEVSLKEVATKAS